MDRDSLKKISVERQQFIFDMANDEWVDRVDEATKKDDAKFTALSEQMYQRRVTFLATASTPALELHCFADHWNWGGGLEAMRQVAVHPNCDAATALLLFWRSDPEYYLQFSSRDDVPDYNRDGFDLTQLIQERVLRGGYSSSGQIGFSPRQDVRIGEPVPGRRVIPEIMIQAVLACRKLKSRVTDSFPVVQLEGFCQVGFSRSLFSWRCIIAGIQNLRLELFFYLHNLCYHSATYPR